MRDYLKKAVTMLVLVVFAASMLVGCTTHEHIIGTGAATGYTESAKQWYLLWGLMALNDADTKAMSGGAENYKIITQTTLIDAVLSGVLSVISLQVRTVRVIK